jgi:hypothetical protein
MALRYVTELVQEPFERAENVLECNLRDLPSEFNHTAAALQLLRTIKEESLM